MSNMKNMDNMKNIKLSKHAFFKLVELKGFLKANSWNDFAFKIDKILRKSKNG